MSKTTKIFILVGAIILVASGCRVVKFPSNIGDFVTAGEGTTVAVPGNFDGIISPEENARVENGMSVEQTRYLVGQDLRLFSNTAGYATYVYDLRNLEKYGFGCNQFVDYEYDANKLWRRNYSPPTCLHLG